MNQTEVNETTSETPVVAKPQDTEQLIKATDRPGQEARLPHLRGNE